MSPANMGKIEAGMRLALAFQAAFNQHNSAAIADLLSEDCVFESPDPTPDGSSYTGKTALAQYWTDFFRAFPQSHLEVEEVFGFGARCILRWRRTWQSASGEACHLRGVDIFQVQAGLICAQLSYVKRE